MTRMQDKVVLVTGATRGIGEVTALELARMGATVVLVGRDQDRCEATAKRIQQQTGRSNISFLVGDLSKRQDTHRVAREFLAAHQRLDVLINNAGAMYVQRHVTEDGFELTFALNHLSYFLLTHLLLDVLKKTAADQGEARIVNVSSEAHRMVKTLDFDDLQHEKRYSPRVYNETKLMNILFTYELAERLRGTKITTNCLHPGLVRSGFARNNNLLVTALWSVFQMFAGSISVEEGAKPSVYLASAPEMQGVTGRYYDRLTERRSSDLSYNLAARKRLWQVSETLAQVTADEGRPESPAETTVR